MTALYVILGIVLFFCFLLSLRVRVRVMLGSDLRARAGLGPVMLTLLPQKKKKIKLSAFTYEKHQKRLEKERRKKLKKARKKKAKSENRAKTDEIRKKAENASLSHDKGDAAVSVLEIIRFALDEFPRLASYFHIHIRRLRIVVGGEDAAKIALDYGKLEAAVSLTAELLENKTKLHKIKDGDISVRADFLAPKTSVEMDIALSVSLFSLVRVAVHSIKWFIGMKMKKSA